MNKDISRTKTFALWLLRHVGPRQNRETIIGDLLEQLPEGRSAAWIWREVFSALIAGIRIRWADVGLALLGPVLPILLGRPVLPISLWRLPNPFLDGVSDWGLSWPLSAVIDCGFRVSILSFLLMIEIMVVLAFQRRLSRANFKRSVFIIVPILSAGLFLTLELDGYLPRRIENVAAQVPFFCAMLAVLLFNGRGRFGISRGGSSPQLV